MSGPVYMVSGTRHNPTQDGYPGWDIFPLICLKNSTSRSHEVGQTTRVVRQLLHN